METKHYLIIIIAFLLLFNFIQLIINVLQFFNYENLKQTHNSYVSETKSKIQDLENEKKQLESDLSEIAKNFANLQENYSYLNNSYNLLIEENQKLNQSYNSIVKEYTLLSQNYSSLKNEAENLVRRLDNYAQKINDSMAWFSMNSNIYNIDNYLKTTLINDLKHDCYRSTYNTCTIKTACFMLVNEEFYGLKYKTDTSLYEKEDKLASLDEFILKRGGDCEDYSLFFKAEINGLLEDCKGKEIIIETYVPSRRQETYYVNYRSTWLIKNVEAKNLQSGNIYPVVVCYLTKPKEGHCVVAFSKYPIKSSADINKLNGAELIEPQDGSYLGTIGKDINLPTVPNRVKEIINVITDDDLYSFDSDGWTGYKDFNTEISKMKAKLTGYTN